MRRAGASMVKWGFTKQSRTAPAVVDVALLSPPEVFVDEFDIEGALAAAVGRAGTTSSSSGSSPSNSSGSSPATTGAAVNIGLAPAIFGPGPLMCKKKGANE